MLNDHVVLVTGGAAGLGKGVAAYCRQAGAEVALMDISASGLEGCRAEFGPDALLIQGDVTRMADLQRCREQILSRYGRLDALIGTHGIFDGNVPLSQTPIEQIDALFDEIFHINVKGYILAARLFIDLLQASRGAIVFTSSTAAYAADGGGAMYTASKGAICSLVHQLAYEFSPGVRVNGVAPAGIGGSSLRGPRALGLAGQKQSDIPKDVFLSLFRSISLLQELPAAEDYAPIYAFLASRSNLVMTGQIIVADQGLLNRPALSAPALK